MVVFLRYALLVWLYVFLLLVLRMIYRDLRQLDDQQVKAVLSAPALHGCLKWREGSAGEEGKEFPLGEHTTK